MAANTSQDSEAPQGFPIVRFGDSQIIHYDGGDMEGGYNITFCGLVYKPRSASYPDQVCNCSNCLRVALFGARADEVADSFLKGFRDSELETQQIQGGD